MLLQREHREQIKHVREAIRAKAERIDRFRESANNVKEKQALNIRYCVGGGRDIKTYSICVCIL